MNKPASATPGQSKISSKLRALRERFREQVQKSTFAPLLVRAFGIGIALVLLSYIGRSAVVSSDATAATATQPAPSASSALNEKNRAPSERSNNDGARAEPAAAVAPSATAPAIATAAPQANTAEATDSATAAPGEHERNERGSASRPSRATPSDPVYLNSAGEDELRRLPGVGAKRANAIVALRHRVGRFQRIEDLMRVKGVGRSFIRKWRPLVRLDAPAPDAGATP
ncbi:MAG: helix-hairpin-helix domain-containing protein [Polyangiaceae bacterium]|nr:helix-hairpin-helix domain-containing protein [Polyangiaceae bacterium]